MFKSNLAGLIAPLAVAGALASSADAADYVKTQKFLGWETTTVTRTQPGVVYTPQRVIYQDACGNCCEGVGYAPRAAEVITGKCTTVHWNARDSIPGRAIGFLDGVGKAFEKAVTPRPMTPRPCIPDGCAPSYSPVVPYRAPAPIVTPDCGCH